MNPTTADHRANQLPSFDAEKFVSQNQTEEKYGRLRPGGEGLNILELYGLTGLGKTEFIKWIRHDSQQKGTFFAYLSLTFPLQPNEIVVDFIRQLAITHSANALVQRYLAQARQIPDAQGAWQDFLAKVLAQLAEQQSFTLCIDHTESSLGNRAFWIEFQEKVLPRLLGVANFRLVVAGQPPTYWEPSVRRQIVPRVAEQKLEYFDWAGTHAQIQQYADYHQLRIPSETITDHVHQLTHGHPWSVARLLAFWTKEGTQDFDANGEWYADGVKQLANELIEQRLVPRLALPQEYPVPQILSIMAAMHRIFRASLYLALKILQPKPFAEKPSFFVEALLAPLQGACLLEWNEDFEGYRMAEFLRTVLRENMRLHHAQRWHQIHRTLAEQVYAPLIAQTPGIWRGYFELERLCHLMQTTPGIEQAQRLHDTLQQDLKWFTPAEIGHLQRIVADMTPSHMQSTSLPNIQEVILSSITRYPQGDDTHAKPAQSQAQSFPV